MELNISYQAIQSIDGWLSATDFEICNELLTSQRRIGAQDAVAEVGVRHGKSFVALTEYSGDARLYAIDFFGDQSKNLDQSGKSDRATFLSNLASFSIDSDRLVIDE